MRTESLDGRTIVCPALYSTDSEKNRSEAHVAANKKTEPLAGVLGRVQVVGKGTAEPLIKEIGGILTHHSGAANKRNWQRRARCQA